jgi:hypothetical protein
MLVAPIVHDAVMVIDTGSVPVAVPACALAMGVAPIHQSMAARASA